MSFAKFSTGHSHFFGGSIWNWFPTSASATRIPSTTPSCQGKWKRRISIRSVFCGVELNIVQHGIPKVIPTEACYPGGQESLLLLAQLVEAEIPG